MRIQLFILVLILQCGCKEKRSRLITLPPQKIEETWKILSREEYLHTYTSEGLLDTTTKISSGYFEGRKMVSHTTLICRRYDQRKNLVREKHYQVSGKQIELETDLVFVYDTENRVVKETEFSYGKLYSVIVKKYEKGRLAFEESKKEDFGKWLAENPDQYITGEAGRNRKREYIKRRTRYIYDSSGNLSTINYIDSTGQITATETFLYENGKQKTAFTLDDLNDTIETKTYKEEEGFIIESTILGYHTNTLYKKEGKIHREISIFQGMKDKSEYKYNDRGELIESTDFTAR